MIKYIVPVLALSLLCTSNAFAYVGPGVGLGVIGTLFGIFAAIALAIFGLFWYPIKRAFSKKSAAAPAEQAASTVAEDTDTAGNAGSSKAQ